MLTFGNLSKFVPGAKNGKIRRDKKIVVSCNPTDSWPKPPTQKIFWHFYGKTSHMVNFSWVFTVYLFYTFLHLSSMHSLFFFMFFFSFHLAIYLVYFFQEIRLEFYISGWLQITLAFILSLVFTCLRNMTYKKNSIKKIFFPTDRPKKFLER